jgi:hypothetical protein
VHIKSQSYPIPLKYIEEIKQQINAMETDGIIERCNSPYINPIVPVIKKTGEIRICLDARKINEIMTPDYECNKGVNESLFQGRKAKWLSTLDLSSAFWQVELKPESRKYTAFQFQGKTYHYCGTPFGLKTSSAALVRALSIVFRDDVDPFALIYADDILCHSADFDTNLANLGVIFENLIEANMTVKLKKNSFL